MNNMKNFGKILVAASLMWSSQDVLAQIQAVNSAEYSLFSQSAEDLISAKEEIDKAAVNPKSATLPKMFLIKSMVYSRVYDNRGLDQFKPYADKAGLISITAINDFYNSKEVKKAAIIEQANEELGRSFIAGLNESFQYFDKSDYEEILKYYNVLLPLYDRLDTAASNSLRNNKIDRNFFVEKLVICAFNSKDKANGITTLENLYASGNYQPLLIESLSKSYLSAGDTAKAEAIVRSAREKNPNDAGLFGVLTNYYITVKQEIKLYDDINKQLSIDPTNSNLWYTKGYVWELRKDMDSAIYCYNQAVKYDNANYNAHFNIGLDLIKFIAPKLYNKKNGANAAQKKIIDEQLLALFKEAKLHLDVAYENPAGSDKEKTDICKLRRAACMEIGDKECVVNNVQTIYSMEGMSFIKGIIIPSSTNKSEISAWLFNNPGKVLKSNADGYQTIEWRDDNGVAIVVDCAPNGLVKSVVLK